jgi:hypothetical protein
MPKVTYTAAKGLVQASGGGVNMNSIDALLGNTARLTATAVEITQAEGNAADVGGSPTAAQILAATAPAGAVTSFAGTGAAVTTVYLPAAKADAHLAVRITGDIDQTGKVTFAARGSAAEVARGNTAVFAKQVIGPLYNGGVAESVVTDGTDAAPTAIKLEYTAAAADTNFLGANSIIHFYCQTKGQWLVSVHNIPEGAGNTGAFSTATS